MTHIYERFVLQCPYVRAREYLRETLDAAPQLPSPCGTAEKSVLVRYERGKDALHFDEPWNVHWVPEGGGPYPDFTGRLIVRADDTYRGAVLELSGDYAPPFGGIGQTFDIVAGTKIASSTARSLLQQIGESMEARYRAEEASEA